MFLRNFRRYVASRISPTWMDNEIDQAFQERLVAKTNNFRGVNWLGKPVWQDVLSLWTIQETIFDVKPDLLIECGTNQGGSAFFFCTLFDLMGKGRVVTIDVESMHDIQHDRLTCLIGGSTSKEIVDRVREEAEGEQTVLVMLDSDHTAMHVLSEMNAYKGFVTPGSYMIVQDGVIDTLERFRISRPGPLAAIQEFVRDNDNFIIDVDKHERFLITHHPSGWLKRLR